MSTTSLHGFAGYVNYFWFGIGGLWGNFEGLCCLIGFCIEILPVGVEKTSEAS